MTVAQLQEVMKFQLNNFNDEGAEITDDTVHKTVLSDTDGIGSSNSKTIYRLAIRLTIKKQKHDDKPWPPKWMDMDVKTLASKLL